MFQIKNFVDNDDVAVVDELGAFKVIEWKRDLSVDAASAISAYFASEMNVRRRPGGLRPRANLPSPSKQEPCNGPQVTCRRAPASEGAGDLIGKALRGKVTGESAIKPEYEGTGLLVLEPTYKYILLLDVAHWGNNIVLDDGLFLACYSSLQQRAVARSSFSSAVAGGEGLFNLGIQGYGALLHRVPRPARRTHRDHARKR